MSFCLVFFLALLSLSGGILNTPSSQHLSAVLAVESHDSPKIMQSAPNPRPSVWATYVWKCLVLG